MNIMPAYMLKNEKALAVCGAISFQRGWIGHKNFERSFSSETFLQFLQELKAMTPNKSVLLLDYASIHKTKKVKEFCDRAEIKMVYNVCYQRYFIPV